MYSMSDKGTAEWSANWRGRLKQGLDKDQEEKLPKSDEAAETPHVEEEKSKALCQGTILKKPTGKADGKYVWKQC